MPYQHEDRFSNVNFNIIAHHLRSQHRPSSSPPHTNLQPITDRIQPIISNRLSQTETKDKLVLRLQKELQIKDRIIAQLKNAIKIFDQTTTASQHPEDCSQLKQYEAEVRILTIQNNKLLGIIEKMSPSDFNKENQLWQKKTDCHHSQQPQTSELTRLKNLLKEKELFYEKKIDEFIASHKSLAEECQQLEEEKNFVMDQNQRLIQSLEESSRKASAREEGRAPPEKLTIVKIKEQYAESLKQFQGTITIEIEHLFEVFRSSLEQVDRKVTLLQRKLTDLEEQIRDGILCNLQQKFGHSPNRKSKIYIEEGESYSETDSRIGQQQQPSSEKKPNAESRVCRDSQDCQQQLNEELVRPLYGEISQLKTVIAELESQLNEREDYYTFRERDAQLTAELQACRHRLLGLQTVRIEKQVREKHLLEEVSRLKGEMAKLENIYKNESQVVLEMWTHKIQQKEKTNALLSKESEQLRGELKANRIKLEQYKDLCEIFKQENGSESSHELLEEIRKQLQVYRLDNQQTMAQLHALQRQNKSTTQANRQLKIKVQQATLNHHQANNQNVRYQQQIGALQLEKTELIHKTSCLESLNKLLQEQLSANTESQAKLVEQKNSLQQQIVSYLTLFNNVAFSEPNSPSQEEASLQQLSLKLGKLQGCFIETNAVRKTTIQKLIKLTERQESQADPSNMSKQSSQLTHAQYTH